MISDFSIWVCFHVVENFREGFDGVLSAGGLGRRKITKCNEYGGIYCKIIKEDAPNSMFDLVDTFGVDARQFVGYNWLLNFGAVRDRSVAGPLILRANGVIVMEAAKDGFNVAGHGEIAFVVGLIPPEGNFAEKGSLLIGVNFVTRVGQCVAEEIGVLFLGVFDTKIVNDKKESKVSARFVGPESGCMFGLLEISLFENF